jgi:hypothetical protein
MNNRLTKIAKNGESEYPHFLDSLQNVGAKVEHQYYKKIKTG